MTAFADLTDFKSTVKAASSREFFKAYIEEELKMIVIN
jgi:hypothetical protein